MSSVAFCKFSNHPASELDVLLATESAHCTFHVLVSHLTFDISHCIFAQLVQVLVYLRTPSRSNNLVYLIKGAKVDMAIDQPASLTIRNKM